MDISELINKFTSDPAAAKAAAELAGKLMQNAASTNQSTEAPSPASGGDMLSSVLSDPKFLEKMPQMLSAIAPMLQGTGDSTAPALPVPPPAAPSTSDQAKRNALLLALKPYLSHERAEAVDHIIRLTGLIELFSMLK